MQQAIHFRSKCRSGRGSSCRHVQARALSSDDLAAISLQMGKMLLQSEERLEQKLGSRIDKLGSRVDMLGSRVDKLGSRVDKLGSRVQKVEDNLSRLQGSVNSMQEQLARPIIADAFGKPFSRPYLVSSVYDMLRLCHSKDEFDSLTENAEHGEVCDRIVANLKVADAVNDLIDLVLDTLPKLQEFKDSPIPQGDLEQWLEKVKKHNKACHFSLLKLRKTQLKFPGGGKGKQSVPEDTRKFLQSCNSATVMALVFQSDRENITSQIESSTSLADLSTALPCEEIQVDCRGKLVVDTQKVVHIAVGEIKSNSDVSKGWRQLHRSLLALQLARQCAAADKQKVVCQLEGFLFALDKVAPYTEEVEGNMSLKPYSIRSA